MLTEEQIKDLQARNTQLEDMRNSLLDQTKSLKEKIETLNTELSTYKQAEAEAKAAAEKAEAEARIEAEIQARVQAKVQEELKRQNTFDEVIIETPSVEETKQTEIKPEVKADTEEIPEWAKNWKVN